MPPRRLHVLVRSSPCRWQLSSREVGEEEAKEEEEDEEGWGRRQVFKFHAGDQGGITSVAFEGSSFSSRSFFHRFSLLLLLLLLLLLFLTLVNIYELGAVDMQRLGFRRNISRTVAGWLMYGVFDLLTSSPGRGQIRCSRECAWLNENSRFLQLLVL